MHRISRRDFVRSSIVCGIGASVMSCIAKVQSTGQKNTRYIAAYDTESPACLAACRKIVEVHKRFEIPATFFIVGKTLDANPGEYRQLLDLPLFEIATHTYSHQMLRDNDFCGSAVSMDERRKEIFKGKEAVERVFERPCIGLRPGCGFDNALKGEAEVLELLREAGIRYVSSLLWGPDYSLPALLREPFNYEAEGFPDIWELPGHGWHENLLKDHNQWGPRRLTLWPSPFPQALPDGFCKTPKDEFEVNKVFLNRALETGKSFVSLIWHPWSLHKFDSDMKMLELTFTHVQRLGLRPCTYAQLYGQVSGLDRS
ncbi:MAG: polysaccharide deacetylase family protein [Planctomycetes bacterium]|nr:polysaccharide deacetylase family protein [Planctomycetota bacterium]MBL7144616.1 polysaccharide deacetylase family protein [Phycisphaerae bacterium]